MKNKGLLDRIIVLAFFPVVASNQIYPLSSCKYIKKSKLIAA
jgi:hypothetical protein